MSRKPRLHQPGALYHVLARGNAKQPIFSEDADRLQYQLYVAEALREYGHRLHAYCWMGNHIHMLVQAGEGALSRMMQVIAQRYTQWFNHKYRRVGHLFQGRYKAILVDADEYLLELVRYIHLNPVRAGLVERPEQYPWSGHLTYLGKAANPWLTTEWVLSQFGEGGAAARERYRRFVDQQPEPMMAAQLSSASATGPILGNDNFIRTVMQAREHAPRPTLHASIEQIAQVVAAEAGVEPTELVSPSQRRQATRARAMVALLAVDHAGHTVAAVAQQLQRDTTVISRQLAQMRAHLTRPGGESKHRDALINLLNLQA